MVPEKQLKNALCYPSYHGEQCPSNGKNEENGCFCDECDDFLFCFPDWKEEGFYEKMIESTNKCGGS